MVVDFLDEVARLRNSTFSAPGLTSASLRFETAVEEPQPDAYCVVVTFDVEVTFEPVTVTVVVDCGLAEL